MQPLPQLKPKKTRTQSLYEILADVVAFLRTAILEFMEQCPMPQSHKATFTIHVNPSAATISFNPDGGPLTPATVGVDVANEPVTVIDGGTRPYTAAVTNGALPSGLTLAQGTSSLVLQGVPTTEGDFSFEVTVTDSGA